MNEFVRRPVLEGETAVPVFNQPSIRGTVAKDPTTGLITGMAVPCDLVIETDTMGGTPLAVLLASASLTDIVADINTALSAGPYGLAEEREGCLQIYTNGTGDGSFIRIGQSSNDYDFDGINDDAAPALGLPRHPDPTATVRAGDLPPAPVRATLQGNPQGTAFVAHGEDRVATAYNRALSRLSRNADHLYTLMAAPVAMPLILDIDPLDVTWSSRMVYDGNGHLDQIDLSDLASINAEWAGRLFIGQLAASSSLTEIAQFWTVTDSSGRELLAWVAAATEKRRAVRIGAVTRGQRMVAAPTFADEVSAPTGALANTTTSSPDGLNALGVNRLKITGATITGIRNRTAVICEGLLPGADFTSAGVVIGDIVTISGSTVDDPFNHNGVYIVETVIDGRELILRPADADQLNALNPGTSGAYGTLAVRSSGTWEKDLFITFDPPIPRLPDDGLLRIVVGHEAEFGHFLEDVALRSMVKATEEVDDFVVRQLWHRQTLGGAYDGMYPGSGAGFYANIADRPATFASTARQGHSGGTLVRGPFTGDIIAGNILVADSASSPPHPDTFKLEDVGLTVRISGAPTYLAEEIFIIEEVIDGEHARLVAPSNRMHVGLPAKANVTYSLYSSARQHLGATVAVIGPDNVRFPATGPQRTLGTAFIREILDDATTTAALAGTGFLHIERVKLTYEGADTNRMDVDVTGYPGTNSLTIDFDPEGTSNIYAEEGGSTKPAPGYVQGTLVRILNGARAGWYRLQSTISASTRITLLNLDGSVPVAFTNPGIAIKVAFYNVIFGTQNVLRGRPSSGAGFATAGLSAFYDGYEHGDDFGAGLYVNWRGVGSGIYSALNDENFVAYDNGDGASGYHTYVRGYIPAHGAWYEFDAKETGTDGARGARAFTGIARSYYYDYTQYSDPLDGTSDPKGWAGWFHQDGEDPALIVTKGMPAGSGPGPAYLDYTPKAALVVQTKEGEALELQGGAIDSWGPNYNRAGGFYSDSGLGAAYWLHAVNAHQYYPPDQAYYDADKGTELGAAGRVVPSTAATDWASGTLDVADYVTFPDTPQHGTLTSTDADTVAVLKSNSSALGKYKYLGFALDVQGGDTYTIVGLWFSSSGTPTVKMALHGGSTVDVGGSSTENYRVLGKRWYRSHIDVADWMQFGTSDTTADAEDLPLLTSDPNTLNTRVSVAPDTGQLPALGLQTYCAWAPASDGVSIGVAADDISTMANVYLTASAYTAAQSWGGDFESLIFSHGWKRDADEPRSPFPNSGVISNKSNTDDANEILNASYTGSLGADDYSASFPSGTAQVTWSPYWGGSLAISGDSGAQAKIWQRGRTYVMTAHLHVKVQVRIAASGLSVSGSRTVTLALTKADGTVVATGNASILANNLPHDATVTLVLDDITEGAADTLAVSQLTESLHVTCSVTLGSSGETISIIEFKTEQLTRPHVVSGPQIVAGTQLAHGYRFTDPVRGFQTLGPADAKLLGGLDYARNESWPTYDSGSDGWDQSCTTGTQELRGNPGLVRMTSGVSYRDWSLAKTIALANITGSIDDWMTDLKTVATTGYGGSAPGHCSDQASDVEAACDAAIAETDPNAKLELADIAVALAYILTDCVRAVIASLDDGTNSGSANTRSNLYTYISDVETEIAGGGNIASADEYNSLAANEPEENWVRPYVDYYRLFSQGVHSACVTLYNGAFDPLWYAKQADRIYNNTGSSGEDLQTDCFVPPGTTGFLIPLNPPHGAVLSSLAIGLSFRAHTGSRWGIYRTMVDELKQMGRFGATSHSYPEVASDVDWEALQGVRVELWRYNCIDFDVAEDDFAAWSSHEPEFGFGERLVQLSIDLSEVGIPSETTNSVSINWERADIIGSSDHTTYVGKEHFEKRNWNLLEMFGNGDDRAAHRVDRRHYAYMLVVRFFGGMRYTREGIDEPFIRGDAPESGGAVADSRWELPQTITRTKGDPDGELAEGQLYGYFDNAYYVDDVDMNKPYGSQSFPPQVKFRGARLGWITDRAGDGGW